MWAGSIRKMSANSPHNVASRQAWQRLLLRCGAPASEAAGLYDELAARYDAPGRFYHTLGHISHVLYVAAALAGYAQQSDAVRLAAWLHDLVYEAGAGDNEARSAALADEWLRRVGIGVGLRDEVTRLILLTVTHQTETTDGNGAVLLDADLAVLGAPPAAYDAYARAIRREYAHVDEATYRAGRARVLRRFLARPTFYYTHPMQAGYEAQARENVARELNRLTR